MSIYEDTYICRGKFFDSKTVEIIEKIPTSLPFSKLKAIDDSMNKYEHEGIYYQLDHERNLTITKKEGEDIFHMVSGTTTYDYLPHSYTDYNLIRKNVTFVAKRTDYPEDLVVKPNYTPNTNEDKLENFPETFSKQEFTEFKTDLKKMLKLHFERFDKLEERVNKLEEIFKEFIALEIRHSKEKQNLI